MKTFAEFQEALVAKNRSRRGGKLDPKVIKDNPNLDPLNPRDYMKLKRIQNSIEPDLAMNKEETKVLFDKPKSHGEKITKKLNKFSATFNSNKSPKFGLKILGQEIPPKNIEVKRSLTPSTAIDRALEKFKKSKKTVDEQAIVNSVGGGQIAGTVEAGDDPPVKKKKRYIYGGRGSRRMWMQNNG